MSSKLFELHNTDSCGKIMDHQNFRWKILNMHDQLDKFQVKCKGTRCHPH